MKLLLPLLLCLVGCATHPPGPTRVACVGDSITFGSGLAGRESNSYPAVLQQMLGDRFDVRNFGVSGATLLKKGDKPYWRMEAFTNALAFEPKIVVIKLGTNDSKPQNRTNIAGFDGDLRALVERFAALNSRPRIYLCLPVPVYQTQWGINEASVANEVIPALRRVAAEKKLPVIDLHSALANHPEMFPDFVHPNASGARRMAETVFAAIR